MLNFSKTKIIFIYLFFILVSIFTISNFNNLDKFFFDKKVNLGLDLQGGSYLLLEVDSSTLEERKLQSIVIPLKKKLRQESIDFNNFNINKDNIHFTLQEDNYNKFETFFLNKKQNEINDFLDKYNSFELEHKIEKNKISIFLSKYGIINLRNSAVEQSIEIVRRRIDEVGTKEPSILKRGNNRILVELPGIKDPERIKQLLGGLLN